MDDFKVFLTKEEVKHPNFVHEENVYLVRCQHCNNENYTLSVSSGQCAWCGRKFFLVKDAVVRSEKQ